MLIRLKTHGARAALGLIFATLFTYPIITQARPLGGVDGAVGGALGSVGGATGGLGGTVGGVSGSLGGTLGSAAGSLGGMNGSPSGPLGTISGGPFGSSAYGVTRGSLLGGSSSVNVAAQVAVELQQRVNGQLLSLADDALSVRLVDRSTKTLHANAELIASLRPLVGKNIFLRSVDGVHVSSIVGQTDTVRGTVTAISAGLLTFVSPNGEVRSITLPPSDIVKSGLRVGAGVVSTSNDFGRTGRLALLRMSPSSPLSDVYVGSVAGVTANMLTLRIGNNEQLFSVDRGLVPILASERGRTIALISADGVSVKNLFAARTLNLLTSAAFSSHPVRAGAAASIIAMSRNKMVAQLANGDTMTMLSQGANLLRVKARVPIVITPLDSTHVRVRAGAQVLSLLSADACVTVNAGCHGSLNGRAVAVSPTSLSVRLPNGDVNTFLGNVRSANVAMGVPIVVTPLDAIRARIVAGANVMNVVRASACVTINSGCQASPATVVAVSPVQLQLRLPDGAITNLHGNPAPLSVSANMPVMLQPLENEHVIVLANAQVAQLADAMACVSVNAACLAGGNPITNGGQGSGQGGVTAGGCISVNGSACAPHGGNGNPPSGGSAGNTGGTGPGNSLDTVDSGPGTGDVRGNSQVTLANSSETAQLAAEGAPACSEDGQVAVSVNDAYSGTVLQNSSVALMGHQTAVWHTSQDGIVRFLRMPSGAYRVRVEKTGYAPITSPQFNVDCRASASLNFRLAASRSTVAVAKAPRVTRANVMRIVQKTAMCVCHKRSVLQKTAARRSMSHRSNSKRMMAHNFTCSH